jgi:glycosyltransferase involved in cell wall biosynthesis
MIDPAFLGGAERYIERIALSLDRRRFRPSLIMQEPAGDDGGLSAWADDLESRGLAVTRLRMNLPFRPWRVPAVVRAVEAHAPDIVHINLPGPHDGQMGLLAPLARLGGARAVVTTEHLPMVAPLWKRSLLRRAGYRCVDMAITVCRANVRFMVEGHGVRRERIVVIANGLRDDFGEREGARDATRAGWGIGGDRVVVLFLGNLIRHKGLHRVVEALSQVDDPRWHLVVAGRGPEEGRSRARVRALGLDERVTFLGAVAAGEVEAVLAASDVLSLPSTMEGMPYVVIEAMASGVPVVAANVYGIPELIEDGRHGLLVEPTDGAALATALSRLIADPAERRRMGEAARRRFRDEFTLSRQVKAVESVYRRLLGVAK